FFFSSRRRHTRSKRDWSSDVCSSDLKCIVQVAQTKEQLPHHMKRSLPIANQLSGLERDAIIYVYKSSVDKIDNAGVHIKPLDLRSEERRVGKEVRYQE